MPESRPSPIVPVAIGIVLTAALLIGLGYLASQRRNAPSGPPSLTLLAPAHGQVVDSPLVLRFASTLPITATPNGWLAGQWHLHARVNGIEYMPAAADISAGDTAYAWVLNAVPRGSVSIQMGWADLRHREAVSSRTAEIHVIVQ